MVALFVKKEKTPDFQGAYEKIKDQWADFVKYKTSEEAKKLSAKNKKNADMKIYNHVLGQGGYSAAKPKWEAIENELKAAGKTPETDDWDEWSRNWFYGHGGTLDTEGKCIYNKRHDEHPLPSKK